MENKQKEPFIKQNLNLERELTDLKVINKCFKEFCCEIYTSKSTATQEDFDQFFDSLHFPKLGAAFRESLDLDFSLSELQDAIRAFPTGKAAGLDGFGPEFYKAFQGVLTPSLLRMIRDIPSFQSFHPLLMKQIVVFY